MSKFVSLLKCVYWVISSNIKVLFLMNVAPFNFNFHLNVNTLDMIDKKEVNIFLNLPTMWTLRQRGPPPRLNGFTHTE